MPKKKETTHGRPRAKNLSGSKPKNTGKRRQPSTVSGTDKRTGKRKNISVQRTTNKSGNTGSRRQSRSKLESQSEPQPLSPGIQRLLARSGSLHCVPRDYVPMTSRGCADLTCFLIEEPPAFTTVVRITTTNPVIAKQLRKLNKKNASLHVVLVE